MEVCIVNPGSEGYHVIGVFSVPELIAERMGFVSILAREALLFGLKGDLPMHSHARLI